MTILVEKTEHSLSHPIYISELDFYLCVLSVIIYLSPSPFSYSISISVAGFLSPCTLGHHISPSSFTYPISISHISEPFLLPNIYLRAGFLPPCTLGRHIYLRALSLTQYLSPWCWISLSLYSRSSQSPSSSHSLSYPDIYVRAKILSPCTPCHSMLYIRALLLPKSISELDFYSLYSLSSQSPSKFCYQYPISISKHSVVQYLSPN